MNDELIDVIDSNGKTVGICQKEEIYTKKLLHRIVHVLIFDDKGRLLLQKRAKDKDYLPLFWGTSVGGHVASGESPKQAALREMLEELEIQISIRPFAEDWYDSIGTIGLKKLLVIFKAKSNGPFQPNPEEVEKVKFFKIADIKKMIAAGDKIHYELKFLIEKHF